MNKKTTGLYLPNGSFRPFHPPSSLKQKQLATLGSNVYEGAENSRLRSSYGPFTGSATRDILDDLPTLRERSRDRYRNDPLAVSIIDVYLSAEIGRGVSYQSRLNWKKLGISQEQSKEYENELETYIELWSDKYCDTTFTSHLYDLEYQVELNRLINGETIVLINYVDYPINRPSAVSLTMVESDQLDTPSDFIGLINPATGFEVRGGVEINDYGFPVAYWIRKVHPGDLLFFRRGMGLTSTSKDFERIASYDDAGRPKVLHIYNKCRAGQTRGVPMLAPLLNTLKDHSMYNEFEMAGAEIAAALSVFIETSSPEDAQIYGGEQQPDLRYFEDISPGMIMYGNTNEKPHIMQSQRPGVTYPSFIENIKQLIGSGSNLPAYDISKDYSKTNYSSMRAGELKTKKIIDKMRDSFIIRGFLKQIIPLVIEDGWLSGKILTDVKPSSFYGNKLDWCNAEYEYDDYISIDPEKELASDILALNYGIKTLSQISKGNWENNLRQRSSELNLMRELGIPIATEDGKSIIKINDDENEDNSNSVKEN